MTAYRVFAYTHGDTVMPGKAAALIRVACRSESAARTIQMDAFLTRIAARACAAGMLAERQDATAWAAGDKGWSDVVAAFGLAGDTLEAERLALAAELKEPVVIDRISVLRATADP